MAKKQPNIVFIFSDQHRRGSLGFWKKDEYRSYLLGNPDPVITPNIDRLADESVVVSEAYSSYPVCSPFRAMLFSGRYPEGNGVWHNCAPGRDDELYDNVYTLTEALSDGGYHVGYVGKWHLERPVPAFDSEGRFIMEDESYSGERFYPDGTSKENTKCWDILIRNSRDRKIDYLYAYNTWDVFRYRESMPPLKRPHLWNKNYERLSPKEGQWSPDFETDIAINYILNKNGERDGDKPFSLFISYNPPHLPYNDRETTDFEAYDKYYCKEACPDVNKLIARENVELSGEPYNTHIRVHFSHITGIDRCVGRVLTALSEAGLKDDTIVVFTSDHGEMMGSHGLMSKNVPYEEATAIPFIIRYPGVLAHKVTPLFLDGADIMPTLLSLCNVGIPDCVEGVDRSAVLKGEETELPPSALFTQPERKGVRTKDYLMVISSGDEGYTDPVLYDLKADPYQKNNLSFDSIPEGELRFLRSELGRHLMRSNDPWYQKRLYGDFIIYPQ